MHFCMDEVNMVLAFFSGVDIVVIRHFMRAGLDKFVSLWIMRT